MGGVRVTRNSHESSRRDGRPRRAARALALAAAACAGVVPCGRAQVVSNWSGDSNGVWSDNARWSAGIPTSAGDTANITAGITGTRNVTIDGANGSRTVGFLTIGDTNSSNSYLLNASGGGTLTFDTNTAANATLTQGNQSNGDTISAPVILNSSLDLSNLHGSDTLTVGAMTAGAAGTKTVTVGGTTAGPVTFNGVIGDGGGSGSIAIVKANTANTLTLSGASTFSGGVATATGGTLNINNSGTGGTSSAVGTGTLTINGGTLANTSAGSVTLSTNNAQNWNGDFTFAGTQNLNLGTGTATLSASRQVTVAGTATYTVAGTVAQGAAGQSLTTVNGATNVITGTFVLDGDNSGAAAYTGGTNINGGLFRFNDNAAIPTTGAVTIGTGGALSVSGAKTTIANWLADARLAAASTGALSLPNSATANTETIDLNTAGFHNLSIGANLGGAATFNGTVTPGPNGYFFGGGGGTLTLGAANQVTGPRTLTVGRGGGGTVVLAQANDYAGATTVVAGATLQVGDGGTTGSFPNATALTVNGTLAVNRSDAFAMHLPVTGTGRLVNLGAGTTTLVGANTHAGGTFINAGTLRIGPGATIPTTGAVTIGGGTTTGVTSTAGALVLDDVNTTIASLDFRSNTATPNTVTIQPGRTLTVTGGLSLGPLPAAHSITTNATFDGGGSLSVGNGSANLSVGLNNGDQNQPTNTNTMDVSALASFNANVGEFRVSYDSRQNATLLLSDVANTITANTVQIGNSAGDNGGPGVLRLGAGTNVIRATTVNIGHSKASATVAFASQAPGSPGTVDIRGKTGGASTANVVVGNNTDIDTAAVMVVDLDLRGHANTVVQAGTFTLGNWTRTSGGSVTATYAVDSGTTTATALNVGTFSGAGSGFASGEVNVGGTAAMTVGSVNMANKAGSGANATGARGTINVTGGTFTVTGSGATSFRLGVQGTAGGATGTVNLTGGTLTSSADLVDGGGTATTTLTLDGGTLVMNNKSIGGATPIDVLNFRSGELRNVLQINNGATALTKTTTGTLVLGGTNNAYSGGTVVNGGTLLANVPGPTNSSTGSGSVIVNDDGTLGGTGRIAGAVTVNGGGTVAPGASTGTLSIASPVTLAPADANGPATWAVELEGDGDRDVLSLTGAGLAGVLTLDPSNVLNLLPLDDIGTTPVTWTIATFASQAGGQILPANVLVGGAPTQSGSAALPNYAVVTYNAGDIQVTLANADAVPEPAAAGLLAAAAAGLLARRRRRAE